MIKTKIGTLIFVAALLVSCTNQSSPVTSTTTASSGITFTPLHDIKPSETTTLTHTPTNTPTVIPTLTWTPLPTLSVDAAHAKIKELLETNGRCNLPCWWGIIPGITTWPEALHFLIPIVVKVGQGGSTTFNHNGEQHYVTGYDAYYEIDSTLEQERLLFSIQDNVVIWISTFHPKTKYNYQLHQILAFLGIPEQVYISARSSGKMPAPNELAPAILVLDYSHIGVWAAYGYLTSRVGENISICPQDFGKRTSKYELYGNIGGRLELFDPTLEYPWTVSIEEYTKNVSGYGLVGKLEDVTNMSIETFYRTFIEPEPIVCLETPINMWP
jgi:hypothetical protein